MTLTGLGETAAARRDFERALAIFRAGLGPDHYNLGFPIAGIAELDRRNGDLGGAERGFRRALALLEKGLGPGHSEVKEVRRSYAMLLRELGRGAEAREMERNAGAPRPPRDGPG